MMKGKTVVVSLLTAALAGVAHASTNGSMPLLLRDPVQSAPKAVKPAEGQAASQAQSVAPTSPTFDHSVLIRRYGNIVDRKPLGAGGLTAWTVEKNGRKIVLYTTGDGMAVISGVVWETMTGRNLSDQFFANTPAVMPPMGASSGFAATAKAEPLQSAPAAAPTGALVGKYTGSIPDSIKTIDTLAGIKEGKGGQADTLYIIVDPRCPYCRRAYNATREYVKRGFSIKWIPAVALGDPANGVPLAASILQAKPSEQAEMLRRVLGQKEDIKTQPTKTTEVALSRNLDFFFAAFQNNGVEQAGVPAAFFLDKKTGKPRMMTGVSEAVVIETIFGRLQ